MSAPRGTTPTFTLSFDNANIDLTEAENVYVTFTSGLRSVTKSGETLTVGENSVEVTLTQAETLILAPKSNWDGEVPVDIQINWTYAGGGRGATDVARYVFDKQLLNSVVE